MSSNKKAGAFGLECLADLSAPHHSEPLVRHMIWLIGLNTEFYLNHGASITEPEQGMITIVRDNMIRDGGQLL